VTNAEKLEHARHLIKEYDAIGWSLDEHPVVVSYTRLTHKAPAIVGILEHANRAVRLSLIERKLEIEGEFETMTIPEPEAVP
jgi:hypothetical protein